LPNSSGSFPDLFTNQITCPCELLDPYVLEFTGLSELPAYSEDQLETALIDHLQAVSSSNSDADSVSRPASSA